MNRTKLLLLHGALGSAEQLKPLAEYLSDSFFVEILEFSGHGATPRQAEFSMNQFATELKDYLSSTDSEDLNIFGYSMGGYVAMKILARNPNAFKNLFTLGTKLDWTPETAANEVRHLNPEKILEKVPAFAKALANRHGEDRWQELLKDTADMMLELGNGAALTTEQFQNLPNHVIIGRGSLDNIVSREESESTAELFGGQYRELKEVQHPIEKVPMDLIKRELENWLQIGI